MTIDELYGTRPDCLPRSMIRLVRTAELGGRRAMWVGRPGIRLLGLNEHLRYERESVGRYPRSSDGAIEWSVVADGLVLHSEESNSNELSSVFERYVAGDAKVVFFWESLTVPSVAVGAGLIASQLAEISESFAEFWVYSPGDRVVLENSFSGVMTVAKLPKEAPL